MMLNKILGKSWRTSLTGYIGAVVLALAPVVQSGQLPSEQQLIMAAVVAALGRCGKDAGVSGAEK
jgi:hypothetical protein